MESNDNNADTLEQHLISAAETSLSLLLGIRIQIHRHQSSQSIEPMVMGSLQTVFLTWKQAEGSLAILCNEELLFKLFGNDEHADKQGEWKTRLEHYLNCFSQQFSQRLSYLFLESWELERTELYHSIEKLHIQANWRSYYITVGNRYLSHIAVGIGSVLSRQWWYQWRQVRSQRRFEGTQFFSHWQSCFGVVE